MVTRVRTHESASSNTKLLKNIYAHGEDSGAKLASSLRNAQWLSQAGVPHHLSAGRERGQTNERVVSCVVRALYRCPKNELNVVP